MGGFENVDCTLMHNGTRNQRIGGAMKKFDLYGMGHAGGRGVRGLTHETGINRARLPKTQPTGRSASAMQGMHYTPRTGYTHLAHSTYSLPRRRPLPPSVFRLQERYGNGCAQGTAGQGCTSDHNKKASDPTLDHNSPQRTQRKKQDIREQLSVPSRCARPPLW